MEDLTYKVYRNGSLKFKNHIEQKRQIELEKNVIGKRLKRWHKYFLNKMYYLWEFNL